MTTSRTGSGSASGSNIPRTYIHLASARGSDGKVKCLQHDVEAIEKTSASTGRKFYTCVVPGCSFFWWANERPPSTLLAQSNRGEPSQQAMTALGKRRASTPEPQTPSKRVARTPSSKETPEQKERRFRNIQLALGELNMESAKVQRALFSEQKQAPLPSINHALRQAHSPLSKSSPEMDSEEAAFWTSSSSTIGGSHPQPGSATGSRVAGRISSAGYYGAGPSRTPARGALLTPPPSSPIYDDLASQSSSVQVSQALGTEDGADNEWAEGKDEDNPFHVTADSVPSTPVKASRANDMREHVNALSEMTDYVEKLERKAKASEKSLQTKNSVIAALKKENEELKAKLANVSSIIGTR